MQSLPLSVSQTLRHARTAVAPSVRFRAFSHLPATMGDALP